MIELTSVGVDVGSATTQILVSELVLEARGSLVSNRFEVVERNVRYEAPLALTPYAGSREIDEDAIRDMLAAAYWEAGIEASDVDTGALIVTGEAARTRNAEAVAAAIAGLAGAFVCIAAGPHLEARLSAHGSGAVVVSAEHPGSVLLHVDVGGGTTKVSVIRDGTILESAAVNVGGRLLVADGDRRIQRVAEGLRRHADALDIDVGEGTVLPSGARRRLAEALAADLLGFVHGQPRPVGEVADEPITGPVRYDGPFDLLSFSGGVSSYMNGNGEPDLGDLGPLLGPAIIDRMDELGAKRIELPDGIRATVVGAGQFTTQVSGMTTHYQEGMLPVRGLRVVPLDVPDGPLDAEAVERMARIAYDAVDLRPGDHLALLSARWAGPPSFGRLRAFAEGIGRVLADAEHAGVSALALDHDLAEAIGHMIVETKPELKVLAIDELRLGAFDTVDIGAPVSDPPVLPVTIRRIESV